MSIDPTAPLNAPRCLNCGQALDGDFCGHCGQQVKEYRRPFFRLCAEAVQSVFEIDGRAFRTLYYLLTKPGFLSREYFDGRRTRYTPPLRLFLVISVSFFLLVSFYTSIQSIEGALTSDPETELAGDVLAEPGEQEQPDSENDEGLEEILAFIEQVELPFFNAQTNANLRNVMRTQAETNFVTITENPGEFARGYLEYITFFMLLMMPLLALIQKIFYFRASHYYSEHLVLTLHNHSFIIILLFIISVSGMVEGSELPVLGTLFAYLGSALYLWLWIYLYLSLKNYFQQGYGITLLKFMTTTVLYGFVLGFGVFVLSVALFFLS